MRKAGGLVLICAALSGAAAVAAGAFASHGASGKAAEWLHTGALYQMVHAVAALAVMGLPKGRLPALLFVTGSAIFAGTLYAMAFGAPRMLGAITPLGGAGMILGWLLLAFRR